ncbi:MAG TPA: ABC transporter ATP-binding protein [Stellaceae bacterium]|nr:ABC transporter ATP-binding protein [Stellaceae bacterium]
MTPPLLDVADLRLRIGGAEILRGVSFAMGRERLGIVGQSGSGKSQTARAILRLLPAGATLAAARLDFDGIDLLAADAAAMRGLRGRRLGLVLQDPRFALNPIMTIGAQIVEACPGAGRRAAREKALALLEAVSIREPQRVFDRYPHQLSGGMGQRAMIAMMLAADPDLLIADEPTAALDSGIRNETLAVLDREVSRRGMGLILISHDLDLVAGFCDRVLVMEEGRVVEDCAATALAAAAHPATRRLLAARAGLAL